MASSDPRDRLVPVAIGLVVLFAPVVILALTIEVLVLTGDLVVEDLTLLTLFELYLIDLVAFTVLAYAIYRLTLWLVEHRYRESTDQPDSGDELWEPGFTGDTDDEEDGR